MGNKKLSVIILGAGNGTRMKSDLSKMLHKVVGIPMIKRVADTALTLGASELVAVVSESNNDAIKKVLNDKRIKFAIQKDKNGTGGAVKVALKHSDINSGNVLIMYGDVPLITQETYQRMIDEMKDGDSSIVVLGFHTADISNRYGRLIKSERGFLKEIVEYSDATENERQLTLCNSGIIIVKGEILGDLLSKVKNENASKEYYLTDIIGIARSQGLQCKYIKASEDEVMGVNTKQHLATAEKVMQNRLRDKFMTQGVTLIDPQAVYFSYDTEIGRNVVIYPNVFFGEKVKIGDNVTIKPFCYLKDCKIEDGSEVGR